MKLYAVHDKKAKSLFAFNVARNDATASREFAEGVTQEGSVLGKYPADFELVALCDVSQEYPLGDVTACAFVEPYKAQVVITAEQVIAAQPKKQGEQLSLMKEA